MVVTGREGTSVIHVYKCAFVPEGDHDSGVDENTQADGGSPTKGGGAKAAGASKKTGPESRPGGAARSRPPVGHRPVPRSKSVPKPFTSWTTPPSTSESGKKGMQVIGGVHMTLSC